MDRRDIIKGLLISPIAALTNTSSATTKEKLEFKKQRIVIWKLGSLEHKILPTRAAVDKLRNILAKNIDSNEDMHLVWGPELSVEVIEIGEDDLGVLSNRILFNGEWFNP